MLPKENKKRDLFTMVFWTIFIVFACVFVSDTLFAGGDFRVFWSAGQHALMGLPLYDLNRDGGMSFKYPPWTLPVFIPLGAMPETWARVLWGLVQVSSLYFIVRKLFVLGYRQWSTLIILVAFWGLWAVHAMDGQASLPMLAVAMAATDEAFREKWSARLSVGLWALTLKIFTLFPALGCVSLWHLRKNAKSAVLFFLGLGLLSAPALLLETNKSPFGLISSWREVATSGGTHLDEGQKVRARHNQGFPALTLRALKVPPQNKSADLLATGVFLVLISVAWYFGSRHLSHSDRWLGWLGLTPVIHPLAWFHLFVMTFPLAVAALNHALKDRNVGRISGSILGIVCVAMVTGKTLGDAGLLLELASVKSWGAVLLAFMLARTSQKSLTSV